ncbi:hypothetical protein DOY81_002855, partial [Sarcophaga bullata]
KISNERNGAGVEFMYEPNLWYFNELDFLKELELPDDGITVKLSSDEECISPIPVQIVKRKRSSERNELRRISAVHVENVNKKKREETDKSTYNERNELPRKTQMPKENVYKKERNEIEMKTYNERNEMPRSSTVHKETVYQKERAETEMNACNERNELLRKATMYMENLSKKERDEADIYAEGWAHSYRKLSETQRLYAKKACDDIFILAAECAILDSRCYLEGGGSAESFLASEDLEIGTIIGKLRINGDPDVEHGDINLTLREKDAPVEIVPGTKDLALAVELDRRVEVEPSSYYVNCHMHTKAFNDPLDRRKHGALPGNQSNKQTMRQAI